MPKKKVPVNWRQWGVGLAVAAAAAFFSTLSATVMDQPLEVALKGAVVNTLSVIGAWLMQSPIKEALGDPGASKEKEK